MFPRKVLFIFLLLPAVPAMAQSKVHITHEYANPNARSLIGLPMGSDKIIIDKEGNLRWSQWSIRHREPEVPFGVSQQMDGALDIRLVLVSTSGTRTPLQAASQELYMSRFPFVVTHLESAGLAAEEVAFPTKVGENGLDVIRVTFINAGNAGLTVEARLSGKTRNHPAFAEGGTLVTRDGRLVVLGEVDAPDFRAETSGLVLVYRLAVPPKSSRVLWLKRPHDLRESEKTLVAGLPGSQLLGQAERSWREFWGQGVRIELPETEVEDFFYSSLAYLFILTEYDAQGDLWALDGPTVYRHFWPRNEYYPAIAIDMAGYPTVALQTIEHLLRIQKDDGRWDMPLLTSPMAWDSIGYAAATVWEHYRFTRDREQLRRAYPHLLSAARWIHYSREETQLPSEAPEASKPMKPYLSYPCREVPEPLLGPGEKPYSWGLLPMGYGDGGLPDDHAFTHNVMPLYGLECARQAAGELGQSADAEWLAKEYIDYKEAILAAIRRAVKLEKEGGEYLPAAPTLPDAPAWGTLRAVVPAKLFSPVDPLVTGLLTRMEGSARQGLPTNMGWLGPSGVWPGESMEVALTYLLRGDAQKTADLLIAALDHSYSTKVWQEEILVDKTLPTACGKLHPPDAVNQTGTGDMPEGWAHANLVILVRDMLLREEGETLHLLSGIPPDWIGVGERISVQEAPTMLGGKMSYTLNYPAAGKMVLDLTPPADSPEVVVHFPLSKGQRITIARVNGRPVSTVSGSILTLMKAREPARVEIKFE